MTNTRSWVLCIVGALAGAGFMDLVVGTHVPTWTTAALLLPALVVAWVVASTCDWIYLNLRDRARRTGA